MRNVNFYPENFPPSVSAGSEGIQEAIALLQGETRQTSLRQAYSRRQLMQGTTRVENRMPEVTIVANYMPLTAIGTAAQTAIDAVQGDIALFIGAAPDHNTIDQLNLLNRILQPAGFELPYTINAAGTFGNRERGYVLGGVNWFTEIQQIQHTRTETRYRWV